MMKRYEEMSVLYPRCTCHDDGDGDGEDVVIKAPSFHLDHCTPCLYRRKHIRLPCPAPPRPDSETRLLPSRPNAAKIAVLSMTRIRSWNPLAFLPLQVSIIASLFYIALFAALLVVHVSVPPAPANPTPIDGVNLTAAWLDLEFLSDGYHPLGSRRNDVVKSYLLKRIEEILKDNRADQKTVYATEGTWTSDVKGERAVTVFANDSSNFTSLDDWTHRPVTLYGESDNILVYVRGSEDTAGDWWNQTERYKGSSGVLVNAHYDSVSSGFGATDDGVGVVTVLQLISLFTRSGNQPRRGIVALLNNAEENGLYGARNFIRHPLAQFPHTFLNLEGAGAGGRAILFRSTDAEVTKAYAKSPRPFGNVVSGDGFKRGFIRSGTDYSVFHEELGLRGLDVAFYEPRARYHTNEDDSRNTNPDSLWHMLSAAVATTQELTSYQGSEFEGELQDKNGKLDTGHTKDGFYFDVLGHAFVVGQLNTLFALSVSLLVAGPIILILLEVLIRRSDKWYPFGGKRYLHSPDDDEAVRLHGIRGFFRFLVAFVVATGIVMLLAYLLTKVNPYIVYSSEYAVWSMFLSAWIAVAWFLLAGAAEIRPTALHRMFCLIWLYVLSWIFLVVATVGEHQFQIASGYFLVIYNASILVALLVSYMELFALPKISKYVSRVLGAQTDATSIRPGSRSSRRLLENQGSADEAEPTERSSLLRHADVQASQHTFTRKRPDRHEIPEDTEDPYLNNAVMDEQAWSSSLPQWTWFVQLVVLVPINVILIGSIALMITSATHQTPADGNAPLPIYLLLAIFTVLLLLPIVPFLHRFTYHVPTFLLLVFVGCLIYNLVAFPFSRDARLKYYFVQSMDLDNGTNNVTVIGLDGYIQDIISEMPSAAGQTLRCGDSAVTNRNGLLGCSFYGMPPNVVPRGYPALPANSSNSKYAYRNWMDVHIGHNASTATFSIRGVNSKQCRIALEEAASEVHVKDCPPDVRQPEVGDQGSREIRLESRTWDKTFHVNVSWAGTPAKGQRGKVWCLWSDANTPGTIPAFDELKRFEPVWSAVTKTADGLLEGYKEFTI
ncbi:hypothetical protein AC578_493 [Pseudocercospora eumusae]|uniref:Peptide hydrolase n=1 Tax=Pseudocercospora eumusae TaxID=321146 RepID=A0A139HY46_9PEZI|nr:hypothetical protein AC578_493 [Pseudocercospora eumusae]